MDSDDVIADLIGRQKRVLDVTHGTGGLAAALSRSMCTVVEISEAEIDAQPPSKLLPGEKPFDVVVLHDALKYVPQPTHVLPEILDKLGPSGVALAVVPNALHGSIMLALASGELDVRSLGITDESYFPFLTADTVGDLFLAAGLRVEAIERVKLGIFEKSPRLPSLSRGAFDRRLVAEIESDPESDTVQFVVKARPLTAVEKHRAIVQRLLATNTRVTADRRSITARASEIARLRSTISAMRALLERYPAASEAESIPSALSSDELRDALAQAVSRTSAVRSEAIAAELESATVRNEHLSERTHEAERRLDDLLQGLIVAAQSESARLALLIDTVQSSHFWRLKRLIGRALQRRGA